LLVSFADCIADFAFAYAALVLLAASCVASYASFAFCAAVSMSPLAAASYAASAACYAASAAADA